MAVSDFTTAAAVYCTQGDVEAVLSVEGLSLRMDDDQSGTVVDPEANFNVFARWAGGRIKMYLGGRYDDAELARSWAVNEFASIMVAKRYCMRRGNPVPDSIKEAFDETMELLKEIKANQMSLEDVPERTSNSPSYRNIRHSRHTLRRNRVERPISEKTPPQGSIVVDLAADYVGPELYWL
jgi:hypothetical protein